MQYCYLICRTYTDFFSVSPKIFSVAVSPLSPNPVKELEAFRCHVSLVSFNLEQSHSFSLSFLWHWYFLRMQASIFVESSQYWFFCFVFFPPLLDTSYYIFGRNIVFDVYSLCMCINRCMLSVMFWPTRFLCN